MLKNIQERIKDITNNWKRTRGKRELLAHLKGKRLTKGDAIKAKCYDCMCGYAASDKVEERDCNIKQCPLYPYMPFSERNK